MKKVLCAFLLVFSAKAFAGDAGCGLGSMVITKNTKLLQLFAMTTNATLLTQVFGITSGTSNCSASGIVMTDKEVQYFVEVNQEELSREMAQGHGEKLATLASMKGCANEPAKQAFGSFTQEAYARIIPSENTSAEQMVQNLNSELGEHTEVVQLCKGT